MDTRPMIEDFSPGYMQRAMHLFPKQGTDNPWRHTQNYTLDKKLIRQAALEDGVLIFRNAPASIKPTEADSMAELNARSAA